MSRPARPEGEAVSAQRERSRMAPPPLARLIAFYEGLSPARLPELRALYADDATFKDPFNEVRGVAAIEAIFAHMFEQVAAPRFVVHDVVHDGVQDGAAGGPDDVRLTQAFLTWDFRFGSGAAERLVRGATHLRFGAGGRVTQHRDYWDAAEELYEKIPALGALMRWLKRRLQAPPR